MNNRPIGVVLAAGKGGRIRELPLTRLLPKCMLPVCDRPILHHTIDNFRKLGIEDIVIVVGDSRETVEKYFEDGRDFGVTIRYVNQVQPEGIAHAIGLVESVVGNYFLVVLGDDLTVASNLPEMEDFFLTKKASAVEAVVEERNIATLKGTCCVEIDSAGRIVNLTEKPRVPTSMIRGCGIYFFNRRIFAYIRKTRRSTVRNEREITDTLRLMAHDGLVYGFELNGTNINVNTTADLMNAIRLVSDQSLAVPSLV